MSALTIAVIAANVVAFLVFMIDKMLAKMSKKKRIPEWFLMLVGLCFGATGAYLAMLLFKHKTEKYLFAILMPLLMAVQLGYVIWG